MTNREKGQKLEVEEEEIGKIFMGIMEGYQDSVIPPLKEFSPLKGVSSFHKGSSSSRKRGRKEAAETDSIQKERDKRDKMAENYSLLQSQVPSLTTMSKATREKIVSETINYIQRLEEEKKRLEDLKKSLLERKMAAKPVLSHCMNSKPSVSVSVCDEIAFFGIQLLVKQGTLIKIFSIFEKHQVEILVATILVNDHGQLTLTCKFKVGSHEGDIIEKIKKEILSL